MINLPRLFVSAFVGLSAVTAVGPLLAQRGDVVESQAYTPGQSSSQTFSGGQGSTNSGRGNANSDALSLLLEQNQRLQTEIQALREFVEQQGFEVRKLQRDSLARYTNIDARLSDLENASPARAAVAPVQSQSQSQSQSAIQDTSVNGLPSVNGIPSTTTLQRDPSRVSRTNQLNSRNANSSTDVSAGQPFSSTDTAAVNGINANGSPGAVVAAPTAAQPNGISTNSSQIGISANVSPNGLSEPASAVANRGGTLQPAVLSEQQLYQMAYDSVINSHFDRSIAEFDQYLQVYPSGRFVTNAYYWKGQAYLYLRRFEEARDSYQIILDQYSDSAKLADAMYGLGLAYEGLGDIRRARQLMSDIKRRFPNTGVANLADTRLLSLQ